MPSQSLSLSQVCLSKGLGSPAGSVIVGSQEFIAKVGHCCLSKWMQAFSYSRFGLVLPENRDVMCSALCRQAKRLRKALGGGMRQVGVLAAAGLVSLHDMTGRLKDDHRIARILAGNSVLIGHQLGLGGQKRRRAANIHHDVQGSLPPQVWYRIAKLALPVVELQRV